MNMTWYLCLVAALLGGGVTGKYAPPLEDLCEQELQYPAVTFPAGYQNCSQWSSACDPDASVSFSTFPQVACFCDERCQMYADCCAGVLDRTRSHKATGRKVAPSCVPMPSITHNYKGATVRIVNTCPSGSDSAQVPPEVRHLVESCQSTDQTDVFLNWPVSDGEGALYRNLYCALCNDRRESDVIYWTSHIECNLAASSEGEVRTQAELGKLVKEKMATGDCTIHYSPPAEEIQYRPCKEHIATCPPGWLDPCVASLCQDGDTEYVYTGLDTPTYRNRFCALCNGAEETVCEDWRSQVFGVTDRQFGATPVFPLSIVLDLNKRSGSVQDGVGHVSHLPEAGQCPDGHVYDPFRGECRVTACRSGFRLTNGTCRGEDDDKDDDCLRQLLAGDEYVLLPDGSVYENATGTTHKRDSYELLLNGSMLTCTNFTKNYTRAGRVELKFSQAQTVVSVVGQTVSIVGLGLHLAVYLTFPQLRNLAGKNLLGLVVSLLFAQLLFLVGVGRTERYPVCVIIAALTHFSFLASFSWMHVMAYDIWKTFTSGAKPMSVQDSRHAYKRYSVYGWGAPALIVTVTVIVNYAVSDDNPLYPAYGEFLCWFGYRNALFVFFALPVSLVIASNVFFFAMTVASIYRISETTKMVTQSSDRHRLGLYVKLSVLMGLTWIFGFIATGTGSEVVWYMFLIGATLQGAFICVSFVFTRKVYRLIRERISRRREETSSTERTRSTELANHVTEHPNHVNKAPNHVTAHSQ